ncbi:MAG: Co2+/Mg2+ efflux protein ApaG [Phycisphaerales bacterium]
MSHSAMETKSYGSERVTAGVRIRTWPVYVPARSDPDSKQFVFSYRVRVTNETDSPVTLLARRWIIVDAAGHRHEVEGDGVVGRQPTIPPGQSFEYTSYCPLATPWGTMEGEYTMRRLPALVEEIHTPDAGEAPGADASAEPLPLEDEPTETFTVVVARFYLVAQTGELAGQSV